MFSLIFVNYKIKNVKGILKYVDVELVILF
jgi:hypothetical protein